MARAHDIFGGLSIILKNEKSADTDFSSCDGAIYAGTVQPQDMSESDRDAMKRFGWYWDEALDCWVRET